MAQLGAPLLQIFFHRHFSQFSSMHILPRLTKLLRDPGNLQRLADFYSRLIATATQ